MRARRGYLAASAEAVAAAAAVVVAPAEVAERRAITDALNALGAYMRERSVRLHAATARTPGGAASIWATVEVPARLLMATTGAKVGAPLRPSPEREDGRWRRKS